MLLSERVGPTHWLAVSTYVFSILLFLTSSTHAHPSNPAYYIANPQRTTAAPSITTGLAYAESCQAALFAWRSASSSFDLLHNSTSTAFYTSNLTVQSFQTGSTKIYSLTTLCDGHARVVGPITISGGATQNITTTYTNTNPTVVFTPYPTPKPCSIQPADCSLLYSSWTSHWSVLTKAGSTSGGLLDPPCTTITSSRSYSTNSNGDVCDNCLVIGSKIRLLYWPVITSQDSGNLCNKSAITVSVAPTGYGPNTFVTEGVTITSPSVAVSIGGLSRVDKCGTVIAHTIIPVLPEEVSSVEGARALFTHRPFNFANLNYRCASDPNTIYFSTGKRTDCYQEVPASAYFYGYANAAGVDWYAPDAFANSTIWPSYQPQVLPPNTLTTAIRSIWGENCYIHPDGVWDPPIALAKETDMPAPEASCTSITYIKPTSAPAMPAPSVYHPPAQTTPVQTSVPAPTIPLPKSHTVGTVKVTELAVGGGKFTLTDSGNGWVVANGETTMRVNNVHDGETVSLDGGKYTAKVLSNGGLRLEGQSTTIAVNGAGSGKQGNGSQRTTTSSGGRNGVAPWMSGMLIALVFAVLGFV